MEDLAAIRKCREGDTDAFHHLVRRYQGQAIAHAISILGNREDALDAVQEAFLNAFQALKRFDGSRRFYPWFYVILRNCCYKYAAGRKRRETDDLESAEILLQPGSLSPEESISLERTLMELSSEERELITLRHLDGLSYEELAERLEVPRGTVMSRLYNVRNKLRKRMAQLNFNAD
ncbi:MAG TPA: sigma-70 family RNA polymerase sigma factor [Blastocatellia bacterium]|jgi:RNA polymerase sigma-70 factor (ECF subfamily)|nr:sigma-70 family RNA polymerase sigma factor [Blastocatellia bacterium]